MSDFTNFSNKSQINDNSISSEKNNINKLLMTFSLKNTSTCYNSNISKDFQKLKNNEIKQTIEFNDKKKDNISIKYNNHYYKRRDYSKFLNGPQSNYSTFCDSNNKFYTKNSFHKGNNIQNLNSNLKDNKIYNKLKINDLIEITKKRKKIIEEQNRLKQIKNYQILNEEKIFLDNLIFNENNNDNSTPNLKCSEGVQTSLKFNSAITEDKNFIKNDILKQSIINTTTENDLVNIGNETEENINNISDNNKISELNNDIDLNFNIEINDDNFHQEPKNNLEDSTENKIQSKNTENSSSDKDNEISRIEEYDINQEYLKNESRSDINDYLEEDNKRKETKKKDKICLKLNKCKSVTEMGFNRYENIYNKNEYDFDCNNDINKNNNSINNEKKYEFKKLNIINKNNMKSYNFKIINIPNIQINLDKNKNNNSNENFIIETNHTINNIKKNKNNNKTEANKSNKINKKRKMNSYSYYYMIKEKNKNNS